MSSPMLTNEKNQVASLSLRSTALALAIALPAGAFTAHVANTGVPKPLRPAVDSFMTSYCVEPLKSKLPVCQR